MQPVAILGDVHGDCERMLELVGDLDPMVPLVFVGDYFDRWDQGIEALRWIMARPNTTALLGNHDVLMLAVVEETRRGAERGRATESWLYNGGKFEDLRRLLEFPDGIAWLEKLPAMAMIGHTLVQHSDSPVYLEYGNSVDSVNQAIRRRIESHDVDALFQVFADLCRRRQFYTVPDLRAYLKAFGAARLIHGHTPHQQAQALSLFGGTIVNVDGALSRGFGVDRRRGFVHWLGTADDTLVAHS